MPFGGGDRPSIELCAAVSLRGEEIVSLQERIQDGLEAEYVVGCDLRGFGVSGWRRWF